MWLVFSVAASLLFASSIGAQQIYKWKDEKGEWHFSQTPPAGVRLEAPATNPTYRSVKLGRSYAGFSLGVPIEEFVKTVEIEKRESTDVGLQLFLIGKQHLPPGARYLAAGFSNGKMALIDTFFPGSFIKSTGGWDAMLKKASEKYGPPDSRTFGKAAWVDDSTALILSLHPDEGVSATYGDREWIDRYSRLEKSFLPSF